MLFAAAATAKEQQRLLGYARSTIDSYRRGDRTPRKPSREAIAAVWPQCEPGSWDEPAPLPHVHAPRPPVPDDEIPTLQDMSHQAARMAATLLRDLEADSAEVPSDLAHRTRQLDVLAGALVKLHRVAGGDLTERQILESRAWGQVLDTITAALEPWPDAMRAAAAALESLTHDTS